MASMDRNSEIALADRLVGYADGLAALAFVGVSGLALAAADPDIRTDLARVPGLIATINLVTGVALTLIILQLRRWELDLRTASPPSEKVRRISRRLHVARLGIVWFAVLQALALAWALA